MYLFTFWYTYIYSVIQLLLFVACLTNCLTFRYISNHQGGYIYSFDRMVVGFKTTYAIPAYYRKHFSLNPAHGGVYLIQYYVIKFVSYLRQVSHFLRFPPPIKLTATI